MKFWRMIKSQLSYNQRNQTDSEFYSYWVNVSNTISKRALMLSKWWLRANDTYLICDRSHHLPLREWSLSFLHSWSSSSMCQLRRRLLIVKSVYRSDFIQDHSHPFILYSSNFITHVALCWKKELEFTLHFRLNIF